MYLWGGGSQASRSSYTDLTTLTLNPKVQGPELSQAKVSVARARRPPIVRGTKLTTHPKRTTARAPKGSGFRAKGLGFRV